MYKKQLIGGMLFWGLFVIAFLGFIHTYSPGAREAYHRLVNHSNKDKAEFLEEEARSKRQARTHVSKQIIFQKGVDRMQSRLESVSSDLIYSKEKEELVEHFKELTCDIQEEIHPLQRTDLLALSSRNSDQMIKRFKALEAVYSYKTGILEAKEVEVSHYLLPSCSLTFSLDELRPAFQGRARSISLSLFEKSSLKAEGFQAVFQEPENASQ